MSSKDRGATCGRWPRGSWGLVRVRSEGAARWQTPPGSRCEDARRCGWWPGTPMPHGDHYRCFLPDLAGFTDPQSSGPDHHPQRRTMPRPVCVPHTGRDLGLAERGIRTLGTVARTQHFQCCTFGLSVTSPCRPSRLWASLRRVVAEEEGFEPSVRANVQQISSLPPSTTRPPLQENTHSITTRPACESARAGASSRRAANGRSCAGRPSIRPPSPPGSPRSDD